MNVTCPCCHARFAIEAALQDESARELMALLAEHAAIARELVAYLGLFRSPSRALAWDRALKIAREAVSIDTERSFAVLFEALSETVSALAEKRAQPGLEAARQSQLPEARL